VDHFDGKLKDLKNVIRVGGYNGSWSIIAHDYEFLSRDGAVLNWFPDFSRKIYCKGQIDAAGRLRQALAVGDTTSLPPTPPDSRNKAASR
jgi:hypothetical protein